MDHHPPPVPRWVRWALDRLLAEREASLLLGELSELHRAWSERLGRQEADRRYRRQLRQFPARLLAARVRSVLHHPIPHFRDLRHATRSLRRAPGLSAAILLTVGIGIGGCTAIFAIVDTLYLRPLPYPDQDRLAWIYTDSPPNRWPFSVADLQALVERQTSFDGIAAYARSAPTLVDGGGAERLSVLQVTPGFFEMLGVTPTTGRTAEDSDAGPGAPPTAVVTAGFAMRRLGATRPDGSEVLGHTMRLDGEAVEVVGVIPERVGPVGRDVDVFPTLRLDPPSRKGPFFLTVFGKLNADTEPAVALTELRRINDGIFPLWADSYQDDRATWGMMSLPEMMQGDVDRLLVILMGAGVLLLLIATVNATNLLLSRAIGRRRELAVRTAMGASHGRIRVHLLTESGLLAAGGVAVGLLVAQGAIGLMPTLASSYIPRLDEVILSGPTLAFALTLSAACAILFGLVPTLRTSPETGLESALRSGGRTASRGTRDQRMQRMLVASQLAIAVPLLAGAGLLLSSFVQLENRDPGFEPESLLSMRIALPFPSYPDGEVRKQFWDPLLERITALPGVESASLATARPGQVFGGSNNFDLEDRPTPPGQSQPSVPWVLAEAAFFETLGIALVEGRMFEPGDDLAAEPVVLVDAAWARRFFPGERAVGRRMRSGGQTTGPWTTVIGVVGEVPYAEPGRAGTGVVYVPDPRRGANAPFLHVRTTGDSEGLVTRIREEVRLLDATLPLTALATGESVLRTALTRPRHLTVLLGAFSLVALALAVVGLYGVLAYTVQRRRSDIAVRLALGGSPAAVLSMVVRQGMALASGGVALGMVGALGVTRVMEGVLYEVSPQDPGTLVAVAALMLAVSALACLVPGRRAIRIHPATALREE